MRLIRAPRQTTIAFCGNGKIGRWAKMQAIAARVGQHRRSGPWPVARGPETRFNAADSQKPARRRPPKTRQTPAEDLPMYQAVTRNIEVTVTPKFLPERSSQEKRYFFWAYTIEISNRGSETVQLKTRHWRITDAFGRVQEVRGAGVVGEEPVLEPGGSYEYTSGVPLPTPSGFMVGTYGMVSAHGERFDIQIPAFSLDGPETKRTIN
jgi:ApaG protein